VDEKKTRWTAKKKADIVQQILKQNITIVEVARQNDLTPSEIERWITTFLQGGENNLKTNSKDSQNEHEREIKQLKETIGDLYVENAILKKFNALVESETESSS
jgi:transposase-like protein